MKLLILLLFISSCTISRQSLVSYPTITKIEKQGNSYTVFVYSKETGRLAASFEKLPYGYKEGRRIMVKRIDSCYLYLKPLLK